MARRLTLPCGDGAVTVAIPGEVRQVAPNLPLPALRVV